MQTPYRWCADWDSNQVHQCCKQGRSANHKPCLGVCLSLFGDMGWNSIYGQPMRTFHVRDHLFIWLFVVLLPHIEGVPGADHHIQGLCSTRSLVALSWGLFHPFGPSGPFVSHSLRPLMVVTLSHYAKSLWKASSSPVCSWEVYPFYVTSSCKL